VSKHLWTACRGIGCVLSPLYQEFRPFTRNFEDAAIHEGATAIQLPDDYKIEWLFDDKKDEGKG
jgi:hypothetical protein